MSDLINKVFCFPDDWKRIASAVIEDHIVTEWDFRWQEVSGYRCAYCKLDGSTKNEVELGKHDDGCVINLAREMINASSFGLVEK